MDLLVVWGVAQAAGFVFKPILEELSKDLGNIAKDAAKDWTLEIIINNYPTHSKTLPLLRDRAKNDPDEELREFAQKKLQEWNTK